MRKTNYSKNGVDLVEQAYARTRLIVEGISTVPFKPLKLKRHPRQAEMDAYRKLPSAYNGQT